MNILDICICLFLTVGFFLGWRKGLIMELFNFASLIAGVYFAFHFSDAIANYFVDKEDGVVVPFLSFIIVFILVVLAVRVIGKAFEKFIAFVWLSVFNKILGSVVGCLKWGFLAGCAFLFLSPLDPDREIVSQKTIDSSRFYPVAIRFAEIAIPGVKNTLLLSYKNVQKEMEKAN